jgi:hypothetical protein
MGKILTVDEKKQQGTQAKVSPKQYEKTTSCIYTNAYNGEITIYMTNERFTLTKI